jgi:hypothetical protein
MDEARVQVRLQRISRLDGSGAQPGELLAELRGLLREAGLPARADDSVARERKEVVGRGREARARDIIER